MAQAIPIIIAVAAEAANTMMSSISGENEAKAQAQNYKNEAEISKRNAEQTYLEGSLAEDAARKEGRKQMSASRAMLAESGIVGGSAQGALAQSEADAEIDALNTRYKFQTEAINFLNDAKIKEAYSQYSLDLGRANKANSWKSFFLIGAPLAAGKAYAANYSFTPSKAASNTGATGATRANAAAQGAQAGMWKW